MKCLKSMKSALLLVGREFLAFLSDAMGTYDYYDSQNDI